MKDFFDLEANTRKAGYVGKDGRTLKAIAKITSSFELEVPSPLGVTQTKHSSNSRVGKRVTPGVNSESKVGALTEALTIFPSIPFRASGSYNRTSSTAHI